MSIEARKEYLKAIRDRYQKADRKYKTTILNEFCAVCRYSRKYAIRVLNSKASMREKKPGRKVKYDAEFASHLKELWLLMGMICSKKMKVAMPTWMPFYLAQTEVSWSVQIKLKHISPATMDRVLKPFRAQAERRGLSTTRPDLLIKNKIPIKLMSGRDIKRPGFVEADTVAHCGDSISGFYASSLTMTDIYSGWTENRACWTKGKTPVLNSIKSIEEDLPFAMWGFACDNGTEFLNYELLDYFKRYRSVPVDFVRRRPYKKNDNAHVEQKNWTHVRQLFGYERFEDEKLLPLMNEIYLRWNTLNNFFIPVMKLESKTRVGAKIKKKYDEPQTPYQRLIECAELDDDEKEVLKNRYQTLNPIELRKGLNDKLQTFFQTVKRQKFKRVG